jgi:two-component system chemotaxis sensor kinase CheA
MSGVDPMAAIRETFFQECEEQLAELETGLMQMEDGSADDGTVNAVFRAVHSIKGSAGIFALDKLVAFAHVFETTLDAVRDGRLAAIASVMKPLLQAADTLADLIRAARRGETLPEAQTKPIVTALGALLKPPVAAAPTAAAAAAPVVEQKPDPKAAPAKKAAVEIWRLRIRPFPELYAKGNETLRLLRDLAKVAEIRSLTVDVSKLPELANIDPEGAYLSWTLTMPGDVDELTIREVFEFVEDECELELRRIKTNAADEESDDAMAQQNEADEPAEMPVFEGFGMFPPLEDTGGFEIYAPEPVEDEPPVLVKAASAPPPPVHPPVPAAPGPVDAMAAKAESGAAVSATIRVDLDRVDRLIDLVGELVINEAMLSQRVLEAGLARVSSVGMALEELEHLTREIQDSVMAIRAQPVRSVFQRMTRLVREVAAQTGKQVRLVTEGEGTEVDKTVIERIADPLTHMIRNAIDHGLESTAARVAAGKHEEGVVKLMALHRSGRIVLEVSDDGGGIDRARVKAKAIEKAVIAPDAVLSDDEIDNLIFLPGFSTASSISNISGRGVGMDVVRQSVQALGGHVSITSRPGLGSTFTLSLPLTLAVLDGMVVRAAEQTLIIPLGAIIETLQPRREAVHNLDATMQVISLRGGYVPLIDVATSLGYRHETIEPERAVALLVEGEGGVRAVLLVDEIDVQRQVVIKSLETNYRAVPMIAAATVMGDGRVALILDIEAIVSVGRSEGRRPDTARVATRDSSLSETV